jgi:uncharacterized protein (DUF488 family)
VPPLVIMTIGHSTLPIETFKELLAGQEVKILVDVRKLPHSRHNPQFNRESLAESLGEAGIQYIHMPGLGGLRRARKDSPNTGWRNDSFRGYADYMQTPDFESNLDQLIALGERRRVAVMCAEALPFQCHRSLIADALTVRGVHVEHILSANRCEAHTLRSWARVEGRRITYPSESLLLGFESNT